jgi:hypothetical protein
VLPVVAKYDFSPYDSFYAVLLDGDGSRALAYIGYGGLDTETRGELKLYDVTSGAVRWKVVLDLDVFQVDDARHRGFPELIVTDDALWFGTRGKVVVLDLGTGAVRADVPLGIDGFAIQIALSAGGEWLWYLDEGLVGAVRLADAMVPRLPPAPPSFAREPELERRVREGGGADALRTYADWLARHGDDRGTLIQLESAFIEPDPEGAEALKERFQAELQPAGRCHGFHTEGYFEHGLLRALKATQADPYPHRAQQDLAFLAVQAHVAFVETLFLEGDARDTAALFSALRGTIMGPSLKRLVLMRRQAPVYTEASWAELYGAFPGLSYVDVSGGVQSLGPREHVRLEALGLRLIVLEPSVLRSLSDAPWPLRHLHLEFFGGPAASRNLTPEMFQPLLDGRAHPLLEHLTISATDQALNVRLVELALESPRLEGLKSFGMHFDYVPEESRRLLVSRGVRLVDAPNTPSFLGRIRLPPSDPLLRLMPRDHLALFGDAAGEG